jgi:PPP family 3-phenylpropionic acid transporter
MQCAAIMAISYPYQNLSLCGVFASYFFVVAVYLPFFPSWLSELGLSTEEIGIVVAIPMLVRVLSTNVVALWAERYEDARKPLVILMLFCVMLFGLLPFLSSFYTLALLIAVVSIFWAPVLPLADAFAMEHARQTGAVYGRLRLWGSLSFMVASLIGGSIIEAYSLSLVPWLIFSGVVVTALCMGFLPKEKIDPSDMGDGSEVSSFSLLYPPFFAVLMGAGLVQASHALLYGFGTIEWLRQGLDETTAGFLWALGVLAEVLLFLWSGALLARLGARGFLLIGALCGVVRWVGLSFEPGLLVLIFLQLLHGATFGLTHLGVVAFVSRRAGRKAGRRAQATFSTLSGLAMGIAMYASGPLYDAYGSYSYLAMALMAAIGTVLLLIVRLYVPGADQPQSSGDAG